MKGVVGWVPLVDPQVGAVIERFVAHPKLRGIRHVLQDEPDENHILREDFNRGIREMTRHNLTYDILIFERHLPQTIQFVDRYPNQKFVVDHLAKPRVKYKAISPWREHMQELAKRPNVYCKISGLATEADHKNWTEAQLEPYIDTVLAAFGAKRVMFGSDWPVCLLALSYGRWVGIVEKVAARLSEAEQQRLWAGTAVEAYGLK
jgi:L-fuconolactonase